MNFQNYPLYCYWGGEVTHNGNDVCYSGGSQKFVFVNSGISFNELLTTLYQVVGVDPIIVELNVLMRYPMPGAYVAIPLDDDNALRAMWVAAAQTCATAMQLYIDLVPREPMVQTYIGSYPEMNFGDTMEEEHPLTNENVTQAMRSPVPESHAGPSTSTERRGFIDTVDANDIDFFGYNDNGNDSDSDDDEDVIESRDKEIRESAPTQDFNEVPEVDEAVNQSWITWAGITAFTNDGEFQVGQEFDSIQQVKDAVKLYSITRNQTIRVVEVDPEKYVVECKRKAECNCPWRLRAVKNHVLPTFRIVRYNGPHASNCVGQIDSVDHKLLTSEFVCNSILDLIRVDPSLKIKTIVQLMKERFHFTITYKRAWIAKQKAITIIYGDWDTSYQDLPKYMQALKESNSGTIVEWKLLQTADPSVYVFQRVFWAFKPSIVGFRYCRPLITIDGTHLYGRYKGALLIAMASDANFQLFPLAFAVVEGENADSWSWFMACVRARVTQREGLCVISDRHAGILSTMNEVGSNWEQPHAFHIYCMRHLASNVNKQFKSIHVKNLFGKAADARQKKKFNYYMNRIAQLNADARRYLAEIPREKWSLYYDGGYRYGVMTTNMSEVFNGVLKGARCLPITALVKMTFHRVNSYFATRRSLGKRRVEEGHEYSVKATKIIETNSEKAMHHEVEAYDYERGLFEVKTARGSRRAGKGGNTHTVNLFRKSCTCKNWKIYKLPCSHVLVVCRYRSLSYSEFVDPSFNTSEYRLTYLKSFKPLRDCAYWSDYNGPTIVPN